MPGRACARLQFMMQLNKLLRIPALLALAVAVLAAAETAAHAQTVDQSLPPLADLSIDTEIRSARTAWIVTVKANRIGRHPLARVRDVKVLFSFETVSPSPQISGLASPLEVGPRIKRYGTFDNSSMIWTIPELSVQSFTSSETAAVAVVHVPNIPTVSRPVVVRLKAEIIGSDPAEPPGFDNNNVAEMLSASETGGRGHHPHGDAGVTIRGISERSPNAGGATTFTVVAHNEPRFYSRPLEGLTYSHTQLGVRVRIELSPGLTFAGIPTAPSGTTFSTTTGIWDVGTLEAEDADAKSLPVAVNLTSDSLADLPLEKRCLTAEVIRAVPWFASDIRKRENDIATLCLGERGEALLSGVLSDVLLFYVRDCVGDTSAPCTSADTVELLARDDTTVSDDWARRVTRSREVRSTYVRPEQITVHVQDPFGRQPDGTWRTGEPGLVHKLDITGLSVPGTWTHLKRSISVPDGVTLPGSFSIRPSSVLTFNFLDPVNAKQAGPFRLSNTFSVEQVVIFGALGTYRVTPAFHFTHKTIDADTDGNKDVFTASGTYTFHVGPMAELEVRDAEASPAVAADRQAYTVMAVNNGPDEAPAVQVTGLPTGVTEYAASVGEYDPTSGVWTIGRLRVGNYRSLGRADEGPTLTLITADAAGSKITPAIENTQDYCVRIKTGATDPTNDLKCLGNLPTGYTEHSVAYYDYIVRNDSATITARAGTGVGVSGAPQSVEAIATTSGVVVTWQPVERVNGLPVTHYEVERNGVILGDNPEGTTYLHRTGSGSAAYRVRAVNNFDVPGPWSESSSRRPGAPKGISATVASSGTQIDLSWGAPDEVTGVDITGYDVEYLDGATWTSLAAEQSALTFEHTGLTLLPGAVWQYRARTVGEDGDVKTKSGWAMASVTVAAPKPGVPKDFTASVVSDTKANLSWSAPDDVTHVTRTGYEFAFSKDGGNTWESLTSQTATATNFTHTHSALSAGATRQYRARTVGTVNSGGLTVTVKSDWAFAVAMRDHPTPGAPKDFTATGVSDAQAKLEWDTPDAVAGVSVTGYDIEFSEDGGNDWDSLVEGQSETDTDFEHIDNTLGADAIRQYRVRTVGTVIVGGETVEVKSDWAFAAATKDYPTPGAPRNFVARAISQSQVDLSWSAPEAVSGVRITGYDLDFSTDGANWSSLAQGRTETTFPHTDDTLAAGVIRQYRLRAVGTDTNNAVFKSGWVFASAATEEVGAPLNLTATRDGIGRIDLTWDVPGFGADRVTGYRIDYTLATPEQWQTLEHGYRTSPRRYEHTGLSPGQEYCYRVAATYTGGTGAFAERACATTEGAPTDLPGEPENLRFARVGSNFVELEWDPPSVGGTVAYYEYRHNFIADPVEVTPRGATRVRVGGLTPFWTYDFEVRGRNSLGPGEWAWSGHVTLNQAGEVIVASPQDLEVEKGGTGSFNVRLKRSPQWPLRVYFTWEGPDCLTESLPYQQGQILLPANPPPSRGFWEFDNGWWGPPDDRFARQWNAGLDVKMDASGCQGGETAVVKSDLWTVPFSYLEGLPMWDELNLNEEEWREKWGVDPLDGISGPSVTVRVTDDGVGGQQGGDPGDSAGDAGPPTAVSLSLDADADAVSESAGEVTVTATLDASAPEGGIGGFLFAGEDGTASEDIDFTMPLGIFIPGGQRSATATVSITDDDLDEADETVVMSALFDIGTALLEDKITLTITDDDTAGVTVNAASPLVVAERGTVTYTVVLGSQPTADVTITATSGDVDAASVSPASRAFTPSAWDAPLTFTVSGIVDTDTDDESVGISHGLTSDDPQYAVLQVSTVSVSVTDTTAEREQPQAPPNQAPTVSSAISDATIVNESGTREFSLSGVFSDADSDALTITAGSSNDAVATVSVAADYSTLTVTAKSRGTATVTVTADDGKGSTVEDAFTITVKAAPVVASAIGDMSLEVGDTRDVSLSAVFSDADGDALNFTAAATDLDVVNAILFQGTLTIIAATDGAETITVTAQDSDGNTVSDAFDVSVSPAEVDHGEPTPVSDLRCVAKTDQVAFLWDAPQWSGGAVYAYDYDLTLPNGEEKQSRLIGFDFPLVRHQGDYQAGTEASISVKVVYQLPDGSEVSSAAAPLTCTVE